MTNFRLIAAATISLLVATPALAAQHHGHHRHAYSRVQQAPAFSYGSPYNAYGFYGGDEFAPRNDIDSGDFARRNTFN